MGDCVLGSLDGEGDAGPSAGGSRIIRDATAQVVTAATSR